MIVGHAIHAVIVLRKSPSATKRSLHQIEGSIPLEEEEEEKNTIWNEGSLTKEIQNIFEEFWYFVFRSAFEEKAVEFVNKR